VAPIINTSNIVRGKVMAPAIIYEKLGVFYLGKRFDLASRTRLAEPILYDSKDLVTHAVCVGMTGSGKTGLAIDVIEEAAIDGIPVLAIDPKGDLANLLLSPGPQEADAWHQGLADWDQDESRGARMRAAADFRVYTPGSRAGIPLSILKSLSPPPGTDPEATALRSSAIAASLLTLAGFDNPSPHGREQVFLSTLLGEAWRVGASLDLPTLVQQIQRPPMTSVGVLDLETFYPARDRQDLALRLNSVLAAPGFDVWLAGEALDVASLLHAPDGRPRVSIVSIAHLGDAERMMVVSLLLNAVLEWTRQQTGTSSLRALVYMDEVFGYFPPTANPPSKAPLLTLLKQARAFGVGVMLSTQNPVDLDYKGLSNTGTWFIGKLQTERDKARVLDGLEGAASGLDRQELDRTLSALPGRVFLMHNVHEQAPVVFQTRWTLSYLRGPMGLEEIRQLNAERVVDAPRPAGAAPATAAGLDSRPVLPAGLTEFHVPGGSGAYEPALYGSARVHYRDARRGVDVVIDVRALTPLTDSAITADWDQATTAVCAPGDLLPSAPSATATYGTVPAPALNPKQYAEWSRDFERWLLRTQSLRLFSLPALKLSSRPGESEREFGLRVQHALREQRDEAVQALRAKYATRIARAEEKARRAHEVVAREQNQVAQQKVQTAVSFGATLLGALMGRKAVSMSTLGRATTAMRGVSRSAKEREDVARAEARADDVETDLKELREELEAEVGLIASEAEAPIAFDTVDIKPSRGGTDVQLVTLVWNPRT